MESVLCRKQFSFILLIHHINNYSFDKIHNYETANIILQNNCSIAYADSSASTFFYFKTWTIPNKKSTFFKQTPNTDIFKYSMICI